MAYPGKAIEEEGLKMAIVHRPRSSTTSPPALNFSGETMSIYEDALLSAGPGPAIVSRQPSPSIHGDGPLYGASGPDLLRSSTLIPHPLLLSMTKMVSAKKILIIRPRPTRTSTPALSTYAIGERLMMEIERVDSLRSRERRALNLAAAVAFYDLDKILEARSLKRVRVEYIEYARTLAMTKVGVVSELVKLIQAYLVNGFAANLLPRYRRSKQEQIDNDIIGSSSRPASPPSSPC